MELVILDGREMKTRQAAHMHLKESLGFPEYYGCNLDALWDMVSAIDADVRLIHAREMLSTLSDYGEKLLALLIDAADENPAFSFSVEDVEESDAASDN